MEKDLNRKSLAQELQEEQTLIKLQQLQSFRKYLEQNKEQFDLSESLKDLINDEDSDGISELVCSRIKKYLKIYSIRGSITELWVYWNGIYLPYGETYINEMARVMMGKYFRSNYLYNVKFKIQADTYIDSEDFFNQNLVEEVPVENGILNILTGQLSSFTPEKIFFNKLPVVFDPKAKCSKIHDFLSDILPDQNDVKFIYELMGYLLYKENYFEKAFMLVGGGRNGKSKLLRLIKKFLGANNVVSLSISQMTELNSSVYLLHGRLANLAADLSKTSLKDAGVLKKLIGRDTINCPRKYMNDLIFVNHAKLLFACNELPRVFDMTDGFWDKWEFLEFPFKFISQEEFDKLSEIDKEKKKIKDENILEKISTPEELSGLLNQALIGLHRLMEKKNFTNSKSSREIKDLWIRKSDSFMAFCFDCLKSNEDAIIMKRDLRIAFSKYCKQHRIVGVSDVSIKITLQEMFGASEDKKTVRGTQEHVWTGIDYSGKRLTNVYSLEGKNYD